MTTEDDFHDALDTNINDWQTRLVFADWLQDRGDPRAEGYRALSLGHIPDRTSSGDRVLAWHWWRRHHNGRAYPSKRVSLPYDWYDKVPGRKAVPRRGHHLRRDFATRRAAEDDAALAFSKLPAARRAKLLKRPRTEV